MDPIARPALSRQWSSGAEGGMQLELSADIDGRMQPVLTILADARDESLWVQLQAGATPVQIPLQALRAALDAAGEQVHSEHWFAAHPLDGDA